MHAILSPNQLEELRQFDTPTVSNAIERFGLRDRAEGYVDATVKCLFPDLGVMVGYAATSVTVARVPGEGAAVPTEDYLAYLAGVPAPRVAVSHDADRPPGVGAFMGEVNGTMHRALGTVGHVTDGCARDLDALHDMGFHVFALGACVSHAHIHLRAVGVPVAVGGCVIRSGDLLHADRHGVCVIPPACATQLADACRAVIEDEREILEFCRREEVSLAELTALLRRRRERR